MAALRTEHPPTPPVEVVDRVQEDSHVAPGRVLPLMEIGRVHTWCRCSSEVLVVERRSLVAEASDASESNGQGRDRTLRLPDWAP